MVDLLKNKKISKEAFVLNNYWLKMRGLLVFSQSLCSYKLMQHSLMTVYFLGRTSICWLTCISSQTISICLMQLKTQNPLLTIFFCIARVSLLFEINISAFRHFIRINNNIAVYLLKPSVAIFKHLQREVGWYASSNAIDRVLNHVLSILRCVHFHVHMPSWLIALHAQRHEVLWVSAHWPYDTFNSKHYPIFDS